MDVSMVATVAWGWEAWAIEDIRAGIHSITSDACAILPMTLTSLPLAVSLPAVADIIYSDSPQHYHFLRLLTIAFLTLVPLQSFHCHQRCIIDQISSLGPYPTFFSFIWVHSTISLIDTAATSSLFKICMQSSCSIEYPYEPSNFHSVRSTTSSKQLWSMNALRVM